MLSFRRARRDDVPAIVEMLADDVLGAARERVEDPLPSAYFDAFAAIDADPNQHLLVAEQDGAIVGCLQLSFLAGLSRRGAWRALIEGVRVMRQKRGQRIGERMIAQAIDLARQRGCQVAQLTTDKRRHDTHRFYERLGFVASHEGMKLDLGATAGVPKDA